MSTGVPSPAGTGTGTSHGLFGSSGIGGFGYGVGVSIGILLIVSTIAFAIYFCTRTSSMPVAAAIATGAVPAPRRRRNDDDGDIEVGIDEATLEAFPAVVYGEARKQRAAGEEAACCPVCLESYGDHDVLRVLPDCRHLFHRECVDPWLRQRPTCPVCRTSPLPSPLPTPLAEVTPLALSRPS